MTRLSSVLLAVTAAPALLLALASWALWRLFRGAAAAAVPRPEASEWDNAPLSLFLRRKLPARPDAELPPRAAPLHRLIGKAARSLRRCDMN